MECKETRICGCFRQRNGLNVPSECSIPEMCRKYKQIEAELFGVMHSIEKWFDEDDERLKNNPTTVAGNAREIALKAIEEAMIEASILDDKLDFSKKKNETITDMYNGLSIENKELKEEIARLKEKLLINN